MAAERCFDETFVAPQWLPGGKAFWYRRKTGENTVKFILVDIPRKTTRPAFDHAQLANALEKCATGTKIDSKALPFSWIELEDSSVRFRFDGQIWQYQPGKNLVRWPGEFTQGNKTLMRRQEPSTSNHASEIASVTFINSTRAPLNLYQVNEEGVEKFFMPLSVGKKLVQKTHAGMFWRIEDRDSGQLRGIYRVPDVGHSTVVVGEVDVDEYLGPGNDLPEGWSQRRDSNGRIYYLDHNTKTTHWDLPAILDDSKNQEATAKKLPNSESKGNEGTQAEQMDDDNRSRDSCDGKLKIGGLQVFVEKGSLWLKDEDGIETQLCEPNPKGSRYANETIYISPDKNFLIAWQYTFPTETKEFWIDYSPDTSNHPKLVETPSKLLGDDPGFDRPRLFNLALKCEIKTTDDVFLGQYHLHHLGWSPDGFEYRLLFDGRGHQALKILGVDQTGSIRVLHKEETQTFIDVTSKMYYQLLKKSDRLLWASERDGYNHLYLIDLREGKIQHQVTQGHWNVQMVESIDEENEQVWVSTYGFHKDEDPYHVHLVRVNFDGSNVQPLTEGDGTHSWSWPMDSQKYFVDSWSRVDLPPQTMVRCGTTGIPILKIEGITAKALKQKGWVPPERFQCPGRDGMTPIYGIIIKPSNFSKFKTHKYPIVEDIYAGPYDFFTPKSFGEVIHQTTWSRCGYVSVQVDGMGTNWRSKKFHDVCYKNLMDAGFPDRIIWMKEAAKTRPWMDLSRVGIVGSSEGGANAAAALLHHGHFYKVAISSSGAHDQTLANLWWSEQWLGYPADEAAIENSNTTHAEKLPENAKLMLISGGMDHALNPASVMRFIQELIRYGKMYELVLIPDGGHECGSEPYALMRAEAFLKANLGP
ncbi:unnamed protein product [Clonostachys rosea f. rosea IK726]|uniref:Uncharacterized protein n=1 Tax=Clonostachys rosea f. rosea IK726 TaxID=1349383 RepID=A0ACA9UTT3_BIOOC|nr:unnamed protein product [Clonostachys rosea f. rosea IK726]